MHSKILKDMKNIIKSLMIGLAATALFAGCAKEEGPVDPYSVNWAYLESPKGTEYSMKFSTIGEWIATVDTVQKFTRFRCTKPAPAKLIATVVIDESLVSAYNEKNGTSYELLPGASLEKTTLVIEPGQYTSTDTLKVVHSGFDAILENGTKSYILPIAITNVTGSDNVSKSEKSVFYVKYEAAELFAQVVNNFVGVELTNKDQWTCTSSTGADFVNIIDNSTGSYQWIRRNGDWQNGSDTMVIDLGDTYTIQSFGAMYYAWYYASDQISIEFSTDGENYTDAGTYLNPGNKTLIVQFFAPIEARYLKIQNGTAAYYDEYYGTVMNEAFVYVAE